MLPDQSRQFHPHANIHLIIGQGNSFLTAPFRKRTAAGPAYCKHNHIRSKGVGLSLTHHRESVRILLYLNNFSRREKVALLLKSADHVQHGFIVGIGSKMFQLSLGHMQVMLKAQPFQVVIQG